ncbi:hypothetical protein VTK56DRAFT_5022 [Thermocarpiscus australiensis]
MAVTSIPLTPGEGGDHHQQVQPEHPQSSHPSLHQHTDSNVSTATVDIESWTIAALESLSITPIARGTGNALSIPLDTPHKPRARDSPENATPPRMKLRGVAFDDTDNAYGASITSITPPRRPPSRRDSLRRREALLMGKEGSRQRRRWENDHLLHVPNVQPPLPIDWQIRPTYPVQPPVPYQLAQYWDKGLRERVEERKVARFASRRKMQQPPFVAGAGAGAGAGTAQSPSVGHVPRDLRATAKRTPAVKSWLRVLEEPVRQYVVAVATEATITGAVEREGRRKNGSSDDDETDPDDEEEIVFAGRRNGRRTRDGKPLQKQKQEQNEKAARRGSGHDQGGQGQHQVHAERGMVLDAMDDASGAFKRWLTHSISAYYGLDSKSVTVGDPARRVVYVCAKQQQQQQQQQQRHKPPSRLVLPPPLWEMF